MFCYVDAYTHLRNIRKCSIIFSEFIIGGVTVDIYKEVLAQILRKGVMEVVFPQAGDFTELTKSECYRALREIKGVISDDSLDDKECFMRIEKIVRILEESGIDCGSRHDF